MDASKDLPASGDSYLITTPSKKKRAVEF